MAAGTVRHQAHLDHVVLVLDSDAHAALTGDDLVRHRLGRFKTKTADSSLADTYTAAAVAGDNTLIELFDAAAPPLPGLRGALVLSFEEEGAAQWARERLKSRLDVEVGHELVERAPEPGQPREPWYHLVRPDLGDGSPFLLMLAQVRPEYFERLGADRGDGNALTRSAYLDASLGEPAPADASLADVVEVELELAPRRAELVVASLQAVGYELDEVEGIRVCRGPEAEVRVRAVDSPREGIVGLVTHLHRPPEGWDGARRFGPPENGVSLTLEDEHTLRWSLLPLPREQATEAREVAR